MWDVKCTVCELVDMTCFASFWMQRPHVMWFFFRGTLQMTRDLCIFLFFSLCRWHGSLRFLGMSDDSHVICRYYKLPQLLSWACEWILKPDILSSAGTVLTCILYPKRCKHKLNPVQPCPHQSNAKSTEHVDMTEHAKSLCFYINAVLWHEICASRTPVFRERKKLCFTWL